MNIFSDLHSFTFGETFYRNGGRFGPINKPHLELVLYKTGAVERFRDGDKLTLIEGYAALTFSKNDLLYDYGEGIDTRVAWCEASVPMNAIELYKVISDLPQKLPVSRRMLHLHEMGLDLEVRGGEAEKMLSASLGRALLQEYMYQAQVTEREKPIHKAALRAKHYIEQNISSPCLLKDIASYAHATPQYLTRIFKRDIGETPIAYLWTLRSIKAVQLLRNSGLSVAEIAYACGYENANHFSRHIKEKHGAPPTEIRRRKWD